MTKKELEKENKRLRTYIKLLTDELERLRKIYKPDTGYKSWEYEPDLSKCPECGGPADNGHDRCLPPSPYVCTKCSAKELKTLEQLAKETRKDFIETLLKNDTTS